MIIIKQAALVKKLHCTVTSKIIIRTGTQEYNYRKEGDLPMESSPRGWYLVLVIRDIAQYVSSLARINF